MLAFNFVTTLFMLRFAFNLAEIKVQWSKGRGKGSGGGGVAGGGHTTGLCPAM